MPPPRGLTLTKAGGAAAFSSRRAPWAPSCRGGGGASETQTRPQDGSTQSPQSYVSAPESPSPLSPSRPGLPEAQVTRASRGLRCQQWQQQRKVKMMKKPKFEIGKLMKLHGEGSSSGKASRDETGTKVERADGYEPPVQESV
ncbi:hypothetical protein QTO34_008241 [Cnephaeus nilssonii]|uniref:Uncharacterized protein n=1 Tax=Cnephaeus nilssonii TaxID=3371016 RepID=A0AA40IB22_CNENI|nr:hypothetical protein QTO34_008241 [Eptesicus nilssonii]